MKKNSITVTDNRNGQSYEIDVKDDSIRALDLRQIKVHSSDFGMMSYDPAFMNTAACASSITFIDGEKSILRYRGYPIEELAEKSTFLECAYLLIYGELPTADELEHWTNRIMRHTYIHENLVQIIESFRYDAHPMGILISSVAAMSTFHPEARQVHDPEVREKEIWRILGKLPTIAAFAYRVRIGRPHNYPVATQGIFCTCSIT